MSEETKLPQHQLTAYRTDVGHGEDQVQFFARHFVDDNCAEAILNFTEGQAVPSEEGFSEQKWDDLKIIIVGRRNNQIFTEQLELNRDNSGAQVAIEKKRSLHAYGEGAGKELYDRMANRSINEIIDPDTFNSTKWDK